MVESSQMHTDVREIYKHTVETDEDTQNNILHISVNDENVFPDKYNDMINNMSVNRIETIHDNIYTDVNTDTNETTFEGTAQSVIATRAAREIRERLYEERILERNERNLMSEILSEEALKLLSELNPCVHMIKKLYEFIYTFWIIAIPEYINEPHLERDFVKEKITSILNEATNLNTGSSGLSNSEENSNNNIDIVLNRLCSFV